MTFEKIRGYFRKLKGFFNKKTKVKEYSRKQFYTKLGSLFLSSIVVDVCGGRCLEQEHLKALGKIANYGADYTFYLFLSGVFLGVGVWRLLEVVWWARDHVRNDLYTIGAVENN